MYGEVAVTLEEGNFTPSAMHIISVEESTFSPNAVTPGINFRMFSLLIIVVVQSLSHVSLQPMDTPALLPGKSHGRRSLVGRSPWGR